MKTTYKNIVFDVESEELWIKDFVKYSIPVTSETVGIVMNSLLSMENITFVYSKGSGFVEITVQLFKIPVPESLWKSFKFLDECAIGLILSEYVRIIYDKVVCETQSVFTSDE